MGFFDGPTEAAVRLDSEGRRLFSPFGRFGKTYVLPATREAHLRRFFKFYYGAFLALIVISLNMIPASYCFAFLVPLAIVGAYLKYWHFARTLTVTTAVPADSRREQQRRMVGAIGRPALLFTLIGSLGFVAAGLWFIRLGQLTTGLTTCTFFGLCALSATWQLRKMG
jgi:hypothetical protein